MEHAHAVVRLYPFLAEIDSSARPVSVMVVDRDEDNVLREDIDLHQYTVSIKQKTWKSPRTHLLRPFCQPRFLVAISRQLRPEERVEVVNVQQLSFPVLVLLVSLAGCLFAHR